MSPGEVWLANWYAEVQLWPHWSLTRGRIVPLSHHPLWQFYHMMSFFWFTLPLLLALSFSLGVVTFLTRTVELLLSKSEMGAVPVEQLILMKCLLSPPSKEAIWVTRWQFPDAISLEFLGLTIYCYAWDDGYYCYKYHYAEEASLQAQTAALFTNIINEVIFNINSSAPAFLKTVYGLGHRAICNLCSTSLTRPPPRVISFGWVLVYFMNDKINFDLLLVKNGFMSSKPSSTKR